jgi:hypothetical protein
MERVKDHYTKQSGTFAGPVIHEAHRLHAGHIVREAVLERRRVLQQGCGNRIIAIDLSPSDVAFGRALA